MKLKIEWKISKSAYSNAMLGYVGKYKVFEVFYDGVTKSILPYTVTCSLPGIKPRFSGFESEAQGQQKAQQLLALWLNNTGLEFKQ